MKILWGELTSTSLKGQKESINVKLDPRKGQDVRYDFLNVLYYKFGIMKMVLALYMFSYII